MAGFLMAELFDRPATDPKGLLADCLAPRPDVPFAVAGPDLSGLGDLLNLSRQEVLDALFDAALDSFDLALPDAAFYSPDQPRVPAGQPAGGRWAGGVSPGTAAARDAASDAVRAFARGQGPSTREEAEALAGHLAKLTVAQIHALKAEHGLKGSAPNKAALVAKMAQRFAAWRAGRAPKEAVPDWPADYDVFGKRDVFADEPVDAGTLEQAVPPIATPGGHATLVAGAFRDLDAAGGGHNFVILSDLKKATGLSVPDLHAAVNDLRRRGILTGSGLEGRHGVTPEQWEASIPEPDGHRVGYVSARDPAKLAAVAGPATAPPAPPPPAPPPAPAAPAQGAVSRGTLDTPAEATAFAGALRDAVTAVAKKGSVASWCDDVALAVKHYFPAAENWQGEYVGPRGPEPHTVAKVGAYWVDVTADQFGGKQVQALTALDPSVYRGFARAPWPGSGRLDPAEDPRAARLVARLAETGLSPASQTTLAAPPPPAPPPASAPATNERNYPESVSTAVDKGAGARDNTPVGQTAPTGAQAMTTQGLAVSGPEVMTAAEWDARRRLAAYLKSDEYKRLRYTAGDAGANQPADAIRREIHGHLAARLALLIREAQAKGPHPDFVAAARSIDALSQGDYVVGPGGRIGVVVRVPVFDSGTSYRAPQKTGHENSIRWIATGTTQGAYGIYGMKPEDLRQVRALGFNERQTVKPAG